MQAGQVVVQATNEYRLHDALCLDALCQFVQGAFVHPGAGLVLACHHVRQHQRAGNTRVGGQQVARQWVLYFGTEQCFETHSKAFGFFGDHGQLSFLVSINWCNWASPWGQSSSPESALIWPQCP